MHRFFDPWKKFPSKGWLDFWKEPEIARGQVGWVWWMFHQTDTIVIKVRLCDASFARSCIVVMQLDSRPTSSPCRWLNMQKNFCQNWSCIVCGSDCSFVGHYVNNNRPLSIEENGEHSLSWTEGCFHDLRAWFLFCQLHHVTTFIFHSQEGNPTTSEHLLGPFGSVSCNQLRQIATLCSFCSVVNWTHLAHLLDPPTWSWTIAYALP